MEQHSEAYSEASQTSKMKLFAKIVNSFQPLIILAKSSILNDRLGSECTFEILLVMKGFIFVFVFCFVFVIVIADFVLKAEKEHLILTMKAQLYFNDLISLLQQ